MRDFMSYHSKLLKRKFWLSADIRHKCGVKLFLKNGKKNSDMDWAQHIKMDYTKNLRKYPEQAKKDPHKISTG